MVRCEDGSHYTGITTDPRRRMREHVLRLTPGAKYTKSHRVIALDVLWSAQTRSEACRLEAAVKGAQLRGRGRERPPGQD